MFCESMGTYFNPRTQVECDSGKHRKYAVSSPYITVHPFKWKSSPTVKIDLVHNSSTFDFNSTKSEVRISRGNYVSLAFAPHHSALLSSVPLLGYTRPGLCTLFLNYDGFSSSQPANKYEH